MAKAIFTISDLQDEVSFQIEFLNDKGEPEVVPADSQSHQIALWMFRQVADKLAANGVNLWDSVELSDGRPLSSVSH